MDFSAAVNRVSHSGLLYKVKSIGVGGQFLSIVSKFLSDRRQRERLVRMVSASVGMVSEVPQGSVLEPLFFIFFPSELFRIIENHILGYADDTTVYAVIPRPLSCPQVMDSINQVLTAINSWCLKWHMRFN